MQAQRDFLALDLPIALMMLSVKVFLFGRIPVYDKGWYFLTCCKIALETMFGLRLALLIHLVILVTLTHLGPNQIYVCRFKYVK